MADATVAEGWFSRGYSWEFSAAVQHEVVPRVSANLSYHRRTSGTPFRSFSTGSTRTVQIIEPGLIYELRAARFAADARVRLGTNSLDFMADLYNTLNSNGVVRLNTTFGSNWLRPTQILEGRLFKVGVQWNF